MKALSVRQPYAWLIVAGHKLIENQKQLHRYRGPLLIHAALKRDKEPIADIEQRLGVKIDRDALRYGGVIGQVDVTDHNESDPLAPELERWRNRAYRFGLVLANARQIAFVPFSGKLNLFNVPDHLVGPPLCSD